MERLLTGRDRPMLERFLSAEPASTMFLRSNLETGTIADTPTGQYDGAYVGAFDSGLLVGVACHTGNGMLLGHGKGLAKATKRAVATTSGMIRGLAAGLDEVSWMLQGLKLEGVNVQLDSEEILYELPLDELLEPELLDTAQWRCPVPGELDLLAEWREAYSLETSGTVWGSPRSVIERYMATDACRVLVVDGELVSYCHKNAEVGRMVQIGGVWTPRGLRNRGYGRAVVAGCLVDARAAGAEQAVLFTPKRNRAAQRAYEALGFQRVGDTRIVLFDPPLAPR